MKINNIEIRLEKKEEQHAVENFVRENFWNVYRPGCLEHFVLHKLRDDEDFVPELDFVMEKDGRIIGHIIFVRAHISSDDGRKIPVMTMGPVTIAADEQKKGYGKCLLDYSIEEAKKAGCGALCLEGNIDFYGKCGFSFAKDFGIRYHGLPEDEDSSFFLCREIQQGYLSGVTGEYETPSGYFVDEEEAEIFDRLFPSKEKKVLPGQLF